MYDVSWGLQKHQDDKTCKNVPMLKNGANILNHKVPVTVSEGASFSKANPLSCKIAHG